LDDFVLAREDFFGFGGDALGEGGDCPAVGLGFVGEVEGRFVDFLGRVGQGRVGKVEAAEVLDGGRLVVNNVSMTSCNPVRLALFIPSRSPAS
jgi:hypothetical protein